MNTVKKRQLGLLALLLLAAPFWSKPALAAQFDQTELSNPEDFVVIAAPAGRIGYGLIILEQVKDDRPCWAETETGAGLTVVDPLLTEFDFTGICGRSIDSNAYSLRAAGQDLGLQYSLRVLQQGNELVLVAAANGQRNVFIPIGRTLGLPQPGQFAEIRLDPGWRLSRRTFNGRSTGHLYLTSDQPVSVLLAAANSPTSTAGPIAPPLRPAPQVPSNAPLLPPPGSTSPITESPSAPGPGTATPAAPIQIPVPPPDSTRANAGNPAAGNPAAAAPPVTTSRATLPPLPPLAPRPAAGSPAAPAPAAPPAAASSAPTLPNPPAATSSPAAPPAPPASAATNASPPIAAPSSPAPGSPAPSAPLPQPPQRQATGIVLGYRVIVAADSAELLDRVRSLAPQTQIVTVNGQPAVQAGLFRDLNSAEQMRQRLEGENLSVTIVPIR